MRKILSKCPRKEKLLQLGYVRVPVAMSGGKTFFYFRRELRQSHWVVWDRRIKSWVYICSKHKRIVENKEVVDNLLPETLDKF